MSDDAAESYTQYRKQADSKAADRAFDSLGGGSLDPAATPGATRPGESVLGDASAPGKDAAGNPAQGMAGSPLRYATEPKERPTVVSRTGDVVADVVTGAREAIPQAVGGAIDAVKQTGRFSAETINAFGEAMPDMLKTIWFAGSPYGALSEADKDGLQEWADQMAAEAGTQAPDVRAMIQNAPQDLIDQIPGVEDPDSVTGQAVRSISQFVTGFLPLNKMAKSAGLGGVAAEATAGAITAGVVLDPNEGRLATMLNEVPFLAPIVPEYLADVDPANEAQWENRLRSSIEEAGLVGMGSVLMSTLKAYKRARADRVGVNQTAQDIAAAEDAMLQAQAEIADPVTNDQLASLGDASQEAPLFIQSDIEQTAAEAFRKDRAARASVEIDARLPEGYSVKQLKKGVGIYNAGGKRVATVKIPQEVGEDFLNGISERVNVSKGLAAVQDSVSRAQAMRPQSDSMDELLNSVRSGVKTPGPKFPVLNELKRLGGVATDSPLAAELRAMGVTNKSMPGIFRKEGGLSGADNLDPTSVPFFEGRFEASETGGGFVPEETIFEGVRSELAGNPFRTPEIQADFEALSQATDDMSQGLAEMGIDLTDIDNATAKSLIAERSDEAARFANTLEGPDAEAVPVTPQDLAGIKPDEGAPPADAVPDKTTGKVYLNLARMNTPDDVKLALEQMVELDADAINAGGKMSTAQMEKLAADEFQNIGDLLGRDPAPMSAPQAIAARKLLVSSGEQLVALAKKASAPDASKADLYAFRRGMSVHYGIQSEVVAARRETARALRSWAIPVTSDKLRGDMITELIASEGTSGDLVKMAKGMATLADNPTGLNSMVKGGMKASLRKAGFELWINGLLSSPKTHLVNMTSNTLTSMWAIPERAMAATYSQALGDGSVQYGEAAALSFGWAKGVRDGFMMIAKGEEAAGLGGLGDSFAALSKTDFKPGDNAISGAAFGQEGAFGAGLDYLGHVANIPTTLLRKEDQFFKAIGYRMELNARAYRMAMSEGLEGDAAAKRMAELYNNPPDDLVAEAMDTAHYQTFTNALGPTGNIGMGYLNRVPGARFVLPFVKTPTNILKYTFERTPLALMSKRIRADLSAGGPRQAQAMARMTMGSMAIMTMADFASDGKLTGAGPSDPDLRRAWMKTHAPYSIKVGDQWVQYNRLDPIGMLMGFGADMQEIITYGGDDEQTGRVLMAGLTTFSQNLASKTYMRGVFEFMAAFDPRNPVSDPAKYLSRFSSSVVPFSSMARAVNQAGDPTFRDTRVAEGQTELPDVPEAVPEMMAEYLQQITNEVRGTIPGLSDKLPPRRNIWGEIRTRESEMGWAYDFASPLRVQSVNDDPLDHLIMDNKVRLSMPGRSMEGVPLTAQEYSRYVELAGTAAKSQLDDLLGTPGFENLSNGPEGGKAAIIKDIVAKNRKAAAAMLKTEFSSVVDRINKEKLRQNNALIGVN